MTTHVLVGYGYCASHLAFQLLAKKEKVLAISRQKPNNPAQELQHLQADIANTPLSLPESSILYYFVPPQGTEAIDNTLNYFLTHLSSPPTKIIYIGSSAIYGQHHGAWVDEASPCHIQSLRQTQRQYHENQLMAYAQSHQICCTLLRTAGIFGPNRLPIEAAKALSPLIDPNESPLINHIFINDLVNILILLGDVFHVHGTLNIADGHPYPMGTLQQICAEKLGYQAAPFLSFAEIFNQASAFKREFMTQNKRLNIGRLLQVLQPTTLSLTPLEEAITLSLLDIK